MDFRVEEASIEQIHAAFKSGDLTSRKLVEHYLRRIEAFDRNGPGINSIVTLNREALSEADRLDRMLSETWILKGPLHGIPFLIKDQIETRRIRTTFGSKAFENYVPDADATIVRRIKESGGIVLGKANMPDFGVSWYGVSSVLGDTLNPYDTSRDPGGSSSGIGAGIAANFATVGIGEDTAGSIRVPSSFNNLFGIRVTTGLISRSGMCPIINFQDTPGPMARNVKDLSTVLDVIAGYDKEDSATSMSVFSGSLGNFGSSLMGGELRGSRIGILRDSFPGRDEDVSLVMERAIHTMSSNGADIVDPVEISDLPARIKNSGLYDIQTKYDLNGFIRTRKGSPMKSVEDIVSAGMYHELIDILEYVSRGESLPEEHPEYYRRRFGQNELRKAIIELIVSSGLDAIMYPSARILPPAKDDIRGRKWAGLGFPVNSFISSHSGCPSIAVPAGFTSGGIPVGFELLAKPLDEQKLLNLAYSYELVANPRRSPETTPDLA